MIQQLRPVAARTSKQYLQRLEQHFKGNPLPDGVPMRAVAEAMLRVDRECEICFLSKDKSFFIDHVILIDQERKRRADANTYVKVTWVYPKYDAMLFGGRMVNLAIKESITIDKFIKETDLYHVFARRREREDLAEQHLREDEDDSPL